MTREELRALGLTEEQIEGVMKSHGQDVQALNSQIATNATTIATLQAQVTQNNQANQQNQQSQQNQANIQQDNNETNDEVVKLQQQLANMQAEMNRKDIAVYASTKGLSGDAVNNIVNQFGDSDVDAAKKAIDSLSQLLADSNKQAIADFEKQSQKNTPGVGTSKSSDSDKQTSAETIASNLFGASNDNSTSVISHYLSGGK